MAGSQGEFAPFHRFDRNFHLVFIIFAWLAVLVGFYPNVAARYAGNSPYEAPWSLIIHVWAFAGWLALLTIQIVLIRSRRMRTIDDRGNRDFVESRASVPHPECLMRARHCA